LRTTIRKGFSVTVARAPGALTVTWLAPLEAAADSGARITPQLASAADRNAHRA
jgi:hypothetical protein